MNFEDVTNVRMISQKSYQFGSIGMKNANYNSHYYVPHHVPKLIKENHPLLSIF